MNNNYLQINEYNYYDLAMQKRANGDIVGSLVILRNLALEGTKNINVYAEIAEIYYEMEIYPMCQENWFRYLSRANNSALKANAYRGLGASFCMDKEFDLMTYYYDKKFMLGGEQSIEYDEVLLDYLEFHEKEFSPFYVSYPYEKMSGRALIRSGMDALDNGDKSGAIERFKAISPEDERFSEAVYRVSAILYETGRQEEILPYLREQVERTGDKGRIALYICIRLDSDKQSEELKKYLDMSVESGLDDAYSYYEAAFLYCKIDLTDDALKCIEKSLEYNPYQVLSLYLKGVISYNQGNFEKSKSVFKTLYDITNDLVSLYDYRLCCNESEREKVVALPYKYGLPIVEKKKRTEQVINYLTGGAKAFKNAKAETLIDLAEYVFWFDHALEDETVRTFITYGGNKVRKYFISKLISMSVKSITKMIIVESLVLADSTKKIDVVFDGIFLKVKLLSCDFEFGNEVVFKQAYAKAVSLSFPFEENLKELQDVTYKIYYTLQTNGKLSKLKNIDALAAAIIKLTDTKIFDTLKRNDFIHAKRNEISEILKMVEQE